jgi:acyl-CoA synthetase (AMP-forming)/AMP-acid ligase II
MSGTRAGTAEGTIAQLVHRRAGELGDAVAVDDAVWRLSYRELGAEVTRVARGLVALGVRPGDRVGLLAPNSTAWIVAAVAIHAAGAILVPVNTRFKGEEAAYVLAKSGCGAVFVAQSFLGTDYLGAIRAADPGLDGRLTRILMPGASPAADALTWEQLLEGGKGEPLSSVEDRRNARGPDDPADIIFTSGTTGHPKGVVLSHGQSLRAYDAFNRGFGLRPDDRYLITNPFFHCFGYKAGWLLCFLVGATALPHGVFDAEAVIERIEQERVSVVAGPPTMFSSILDREDRRRAALTSLRYAFTAAASIPSTLVERIRSELGVDVGTGYGLTESTAVVTVTRPGDDARTVASTVGAPVEGVEVRIVDSEHRAVPLGEPGEVAVRGFNVMSGYWDDPEATASVIDPDGWLYTGDVGVLDDRGNLRITDRMKDMFIVGGFNVSPVEVESLLLADERIAQVAVVGVPDARLGEVAAAFVVAHRDTPLAAADVIAHAREHMANYKVPRYVEVVDRLPVNAAGKVIKAELRSRSVSLPVAQP